MDADSRLDLVGHPKGSFHAELLSESLLDLANHLLHLAGDLLALASGLHVGVVGEVGLWERDNGTSAGSASSPNRRRRAGEGSRSRSIVSTFFGASGCRASQAG
jgi:hypothetical protein